jgi:hypothetical protein
MRRTAFLGSSLVVAAGASATTGVASPAVLDSVPGGIAFGGKADVRQRFQSVTYVPSLLNNVRNAPNGLQFGLATDPKRIAIVVAAHGPMKAEDVAADILTHRIDGASSCPRWSRRSPCYSKHATTLTPRSSRTR